MWAWSCLQMQPTPPRTPRMPHACAFHQACAWAGREMRIRAPLWLKRNSSAAARSRRGGLGPIVGRGKPARRPLRSRAPCKPSGAVVDTPCIAGEHRFQRQGLHAGGGGLWYCIASHIAYWELQVGLELCILHGTVACYLGGVGRRGLGHGHNFGGCSGNSSGCSAVRGRRPQQGCRVLLWSRATLRQGSLAQEAAGVERR